MTEVDYTKLTPIDAMSGEDEEETGLLWDLYREAKWFMESFTWHGKIEKAYFGLGVGRVVGVFLFELIPARQDVDRLLWVVVGDIPLAYLVTDHAPNAACALEGYIELMREWVVAAKAGEPVDKLIPVNVAPTKEWAEDLEGRLDFLEQNILSEYQDDLDQPGRWDDG